MGNEWAVIHHGVRRACQSVNVPIEYEPTFKRKYVYGTHPDQFIIYYEYQNIKYHRSIMLARIKIKKLLQLGNQPKYYSNFVMLGNESFNGFTKDMVKELIREVHEEQKRKEIRALRAKLEMDGD